MPQSVPPWRVLEEPPLQGAPGTMPDPSAAAPRPHVAGTAGSGAGSPIAVPGPSLLVVAALVAAALLLVMAFLLASGSQRGMVEVSAVSADGRPGGSGGPAAGGLRSAVASAHTIVVEVAGAVLRPGLQTLPKGARVGDAIAAAGGYGPRVDAEAVSQDLNLAAVLRDGERVRVPSRDDRPTAPLNVVPPAGAGAGGAAGGRAGGLLNLNRASAAELETLPGIGPATAAKIIAARAEQPFSSPDELVERKLVGSKAFEAIRSLVTVG